MWPIVPIIQLPLYIFSQLRRKTMKLLKGILMVLVLCGMLAICNTKAYAAGGWYTCSVVAAGPGWGVTYIKLTDTSSSPAFTNQWCNIPAAQANAFLSIALAAMSSNANVQVYLDTSAIANGSYPTLSTMYLLH